MDRDRDYWLMGAVGGHGNDGGNGVDSGNDRGNGGGSDCGCGNRRSINNTSITGSTLSAAPTPVSAVVKRIWTDIKLNRFLYNTACMISV